MSITSQTNMQIDVPAPNVSTGISAIPLDFPKRVVEPAIKCLLDAYRAALPELLKNKTVGQECVAYCGDELVCFGPTQFAAYQECILRGLKPGTFVVMFIEPENDEVGVRIEVKMKQDL